MAPRFRHQRRAPFDRFRSALLRLDRMLTARRSVRSAFDTCPNTAQRFAKNPVLCFVPRESFRNFLRSYQVIVGRRDENCLLRLFDLVSIPRFEIDYYKHGGIFAVRVTSVAQSLIGWTR